MTYTENLSSSRGSTRDYLKQDPERIDFDEWMAHVHDFDPQNGWDVPLSEMGTSFGRGSRAQSSQGTSRNKFWCKQSGTRYLYFSWTTTGQEANLRTICDNLRTSCVDRSVHPIKSYLAILGRHLQNRYYYVLNMS